VGSPPCTVDRPSSIFSKEKENRKNQTTSRVCGGKRKSRGRKERRGRRKRDHDNEIKSNGDPRKSTSSPEPKRWGQKTSFLLVSSSAQPSRNSLQKKKRFLVELTPVWYEIAGFCPFWEALEQPDENTLENSIDCSRRGIFYSECD